MKTDKPETGSAVVASSTLFFFLTRVRCLVSRHEEYVCARACCAPGIYWTNEADTAYHTLFAYRWQLYAPPFCATRLTYHILCAGEWRCLKMFFLHSMHAAFVSCAGFSQCQGYLRIIGTHLPIVPSHRIDRIVSCEQSVILKHRRLTLSLF